MPIYEYQADAASCAYCVYGFERTEKLADPPLTACPACGQPCHRVISAAAIVTGGAHLLREKTLAERGFTQYRRNGKGHYEKTVGEGPDDISG